MNRCPITYEPCEGKKYSPAGLKRLSPKLIDLEDLPWSGEEQVQEAAARAVKMSIQGVQPKLSVILSIKEKQFKLRNKNGKYILKPQNQLYPNIPENEDLTMKLAGLCGITVPLTGMVYSRDGSFTYFIKRFDRAGKSNKIHVEDFAQLSGRTRDTKYDSSMEKLISVIDKFASFPLIEKKKKFLLTLFNFITGNEDMHLKNFSMIKSGDKIELSPAYDLLNTSIVLKDPEEIALPLNGKKNNLTKEDLINYFGNERLGLNTQTTDEVLNRLKKIYSDWISLIHASFLPEKLRKKYIDLVNVRMERLGISGISHQHSAKIKNQVKR